MVFKYSALITVGVLILIMGPFKVDAQTQSTYEEWVKRSYIPNREQKYREKEGQVKDQIKDLAPPPGERGAGWKNFHGADSDTVAKTFADDLEQVSGDFSEVNDNLMSLELDFFVEPEIEFIDNSPLGGCEVRSQFPTYGDWGTCINAVIYMPFGCQVIWFTSSLVEYYYPAYKIDVSEQLFQSRYLPKELVESSYIPLIEESFYPLAATSAANTLQKVGEITSAQGAISGHDFGSAPVPQPDQRAVDAIVKNFDSDQRHSSPNLTNSYGRVIFEPLNVMTTSDGLDDFYWIPHVAKGSWFGADLPITTTGTGLTFSEVNLGGYLFSKVFFMSELLRPGSLAELLLPYGPWRCVMDNKASGKTPIDIDSSLPLANNSGACISGIGEVFPFYAYRRMHITDGTFQGAWRALSVLRALFPEGRIKGEERDEEHDAGRGAAWSAARHTFRRKYDLWQPLRSDALVRESPKFSTFDKLVKRNVEYDESNLKEIRSGHENTFEIWPLFKGCWGINTFTGQSMKGRYPKLGVTAISPYGPLPSKLDDDLRLY